MKASPFSDSQKAFISKQGADGISVTDICHKAGISQATYFKWQKRYDGLLPTEMRGLEQLVDEKACNSATNGEAPGQSEAAGGSNQWHA